jgi:hypothetical protein
MSMCKCDQCDRLIDSDDDPECFVGDTSTRCEYCREPDTIKQDEGDVS